MRYLVPFADRAAMDAWVVTARKHWQDHGFGPWVVEVPDEAPFIGVVGLSNLRFALPFAPAVEAAWRLARRYWGRGYAYEAARAAIDDGFGRLGLKEVVAFTVLANRASRRVMEKLGMTRDPAEDFDSTTHGCRRGTRCVAMSSIGFGRREWFDPLGPPW